MVTYLSGSVRLVPGVNEKNLSFPRNSRLKLKRGRQSSSEHSWLRYQNEQNYILLGYETYQRRREKEKREQVKEKEELGLAGEGRRSKEVEGEGRELGS